MTDRRRVTLATVAAALMLSGVVLTGARLDAQPEEALEATATGGPIVAAIESATTPLLSGLLPTSEGSLRASEVVKGLKDGVPDGHVLADVQLREVEAVARGAVKGALAESTASTTTSNDRAALRALARGMMGGAIGSIASAPDAARLAVDEAATQGVFRALTAKLLSDEPALSTAQYETYGRGLATGMFDALDEDATILAAILGSPALSDVTTFATAIARAQLDELSPSIATAQLDAVARFGGGALDGMVEGLVTSFPRGVPAASREDVQAWLVAIAKPPAGTPAWQRPSSLGALAAWADGLAADGIAGIAQGKRDLQQGTTGPTLDASRAWARGLAKSGYQGLGALVASTPAIERDARGYARAVASPALETIYERAPDAPADAEGIEAYAQGVTAGLDDLKGGALSASAFAEVYLSNISAAAGDLPRDITPAQALVLRSFLTGATDTLHARVAGVAAAAAGDEPAALAAMATGMGDAAAQLAGATPLTDASIYDDLGFGLSSGFLETKDPQALLQDGNAALQMTDSWFSVVSYEFVAALVARGDRAVADPGNATLLFAEVAGAMPLAWLSAKGRDLTEQGFLGFDDALLVAALANETAHAVAGPLFGPEPRLPDADVGPMHDAISRYATNVSAAVLALPLQQAQENVTTSKMPDMAAALAKTMARPFFSFDLDHPEAELAAANATLAEMTTNASRIAKLGERPYALAAVAIVDALHDGIERGLGLAPPAQQPEPGALVPAWTTGILEAALAPPADAIGEDLDARTTWLAAASAAAAQVATEQAPRQANFTIEYAQGLAEWAWLAPGTLPDPTGMETPLATWANASIQPLYAHLPPGIEQEELDAYVAYAVGIGEAVRDLPPPDIMAWTPDQLAAMDAYVAGISSGIASVQPDLEDLACYASGSKTGCPEEEETDPEPEPEPEPEPTTPPCAEACQLAALQNETADYAANVRTWSRTLVGAGLQQMPDTRPTRGGIVAVASWATEVLAGHGVVVRVRDPDLEWEGPRGAAWEFAQARDERVQDAAGEIGAGYGHLVQLDLNPESLARDKDTVLAPWNAYAAAISAGVQRIEYAPDDLGLRPGSPGAPAVPTPDPGSDEFRAWVLALWDAPVPTWQGLVPAFPDAPNAKARDDLLYFAVAEMVQGGGVAAREFGNATSATGASRVPDTGPLEPFAAGLVEAVNGTLVDPARTDLQALLFHYRGVARGGVGAILAAKTTITQEQYAAVEAYAETVGDASWLPPPPRPQAVDALLAPPEEDEDDDTGGGSGETPPPPGEEYTLETFATNMQAHSAGLAAAVAAIPADALLHGPNETAARYLAALRDAGADSPPFTSDAAYPARLQAWAEAEARAAMAASPTSPERVGPDPDVELLVALLGAYASEAPWALLDDITAKPGEAEAIVAAALGVACPDGASVAECASIGETLGQALGGTLPSPTLGAPQPELLQDVLQGLADGFAAVDAPDAPSVPAAEGVLEGILGAPQLPVDAEALAEAIAEAIGASELALPAHEPVAKGLARGLAPYQDPAMYDAIAKAAVAQAATASDPATAEREMSAVAAGSGEPAITVGGARWFAGSQLDGSQVVSAKDGLTFRVNVPESRAASTWELAWDDIDPTGADAKRRALSGSGPLRELKLAAADLGVPTGASLRFVVLESVAGSVVATHGRGEEDEPFALRPDRDLPTATMPVPTVGQTLGLAWAGADGDTAVTSYHLQSRKNGAAWSDLAERTTDREMAFAAEPGATYEFRVAAVDVAGHEGAFTAPVRGVLPAGVAPNRAPTVGFVSPVAALTFARPIEVKLAASDPDGNAPLLRVCVQRVGHSGDIACPHEGGATSFTLDPAALPDGKLRLVATATDGTLSASATSVVLTLDRMPPAFRGAGAEASSTRVVFTAALEGDARAVTLALSRDGVAVPAPAMRDDGQGADAHAGDGLWSAEAALPAGAYTATFRATDANGNEATLERSIVVPAPPAPRAPSAQPSTPTQPPAAPTTSATSEPTQDKDTPFPPALALAALALVALTRAAWGRRARR